jgi:hypothetical protein
VPADATNLLKAMWVLLRDYPDAKATNIMMLHAVRASVDETSRQANLAMFAIAAVGVLEGGFDADDEGFIGISHLIVKGQGVFLAKRPDQVRAFVDSLPRDPSLEEVLRWSPSVPTYRPFGDPKCYAHSNEDAAHAFARLRSFVADIAGTGDGYVTRTLDTTDYE